MSAKYEKAKEILMRKAKEIGVEADKLDMQAMDSLNRAPYIDALLLQNKGEQELAKLCAAKDYGAIPEHYKSIVDDANNNKLHMRVQTRLLRLKSLQSTVSAPIYLGMKDVQPPGGYLPTREDVELAESQLRTSPDEVISIAAVLDQIEINVKKAGKFLKENWREITKRNIIEIWFRN